MKAMTLQNISNEKMCWKQASLQRKQSYDAKFQQVAHRTEQPRNCARQWLFLANSKQHYKQNEKHRRKPLNNDVFLLLD